MVPACFGASRIRDVAVESTPEKTVLVLESPQPIKFSLVSLHNPERMLLDLENIALDDALRRLIGTLENHHPDLAIRDVSVRHASRRVTRIEIDFDEEVQPAVNMRLARAGIYQLALELRSERQAARGSVASVAGQPDRAAASAPTRSSVPAQITAQEALLEVNVNGQTPRSTVLLRRADGKFLISEADLTAWRLRVPDAVAQSRDGLRYFPLDALRGLSYRFDEATQALSVEASPGLFETTHLMGQVPGFNKPTKPPPGAFASYELFAQRAERQTTTSGMVQLGVFGALGAGTADFVGRHDTTGTRITRLDTAWQYDRPESFDTIRLGDSVTRAGSWTRSVHFGGVQWATDFATQPAFVPFPLPGLSGQAAVPSTVDLFVNDALRLRRDIPAGPFSISDLPVVTGSGEARIVVRDALGREQIISQPYYVSPTLLKQGLHDFSYEAGFVRNGFGMTSNDYGAFAATASHRVGVTDRMTLEAHGEILRQQQTLGAGIAALWPRFGVLSGATAVSHGPGGNGALAAFGLSHQDRWLTFGGSVQYASDKFTQLGLDEGRPVAKLLASAFAGVSLGAGGSLSVAYAAQELRDEPSVRVLSASYGKSIAGLGFLNLAVTQDRREQRSTSVVLTLTRPLDPRTALGTGARDESGHASASAEVQRSLPAGTGLGYHVLAGTGRLGRQEAGIAAQDELGTFTADAASMNGATAYRASASGSVALLGGSVYASRRIGDSFAAVDVPGYPNVRVYADNQLIGRTSSRGDLLVPRLLPYVTTAVRIEPSDLPLDASLDSMQLDAIPYAGSGLVLSFPVKRARGATFRVLLDDGKPIPAGAIAKLGNGPAEFPVALNGDVYMTGLAVGTNQVRVSWRGRSCRLLVAFRPGDDPLPFVGTFKCAGVAR